MELYTRKRQWKIGLSILGLVIIGVSLFYTNLIVRKFAAEERKNVKLWADAVQRKAEMVVYTERLFNELQDQERSRVELLADVYKQLMDESSDYSFLTKLIYNNKTVPVIVTNEKGEINWTRNLRYNVDTLEYLTGDLLEQFSVYEPIKIEFLPGRYNYLYYEDSRLFSELKDVLNNYVESFMSEVALNSSSVPVIITDSSRKNVIMYGNIDPEIVEDSVSIAKELEEMEGQNRPIEVDLGNQGDSYIYYKDSDLLTVVKFFPIAQILIIAFFAAVAYLLFSFARRAEQNRVWAGMAKETAHQIGTPLSSILAWLELLKMDKDNIEQATTEIENDVQRLEMITERFSKIGSTPTLKTSDVVKVVVDSVNYLKPRSSKKVNYILLFDTIKPIDIPVNAALFSWVIENLCKNAIDAMSGKGDITINIEEENKHVIIDISDTGKGISASDQKTIFNPGYTSKKRGWGLGLTLAKRIVSDYHKGRIYVKSSVPGKGTTFRIVLKKTLIINDV